MMAGGPLRFFFLACFLLLSACGAAPPAPSPADLPHIPDRHLISGLPFFAQVEDQCGPASLATMLAARDIAVDPQTLRGEVYIPDKQGAVTTEMVARGRRYGLLVYPLHGDYDAIVEEVAAGNPVLVLQNLGYDWAPRWHYSVVIGYDLARDIVVLRSGDDMAREIGAGLFLKTWERAGRWSAVMMPPDQLPATARERRFLLSASDLEQVGELEAAARAYSRAMSAWPDSAEARFGAANVAYATGRYDRAVDLFQAYLELRPRSAAGWNNLAFSLLHQCCARPALAAVRCAQSLEPGNPAYRDSLEELQALAASPGSTSCSCDADLSVDCTE
jgi:hypothetical protein